MDAFTASTLGTWGRGADRITASHAGHNVSVLSRRDVGAAVLLSNSAGDIWTVSEREWLERWDALRDGGWTRTG